MRIHFLDQDFTVPLVSVIGIVVLVLGAIVCYCLFKERR